MNPQGGGANQVNGRNTNNQNSTSHSSLESLQITLLPLFPVTTIRERFLGGIAQPNINLPQQGLTSVPPHESLNLALGSNISSSNSIARTPQNPSNNLDLSLTIGLAHQGHEVQEQSVYGGNSSNSNFLPRSINSTTHASGRFLRGESSNVREQGPPAKRQVIEFNVGGNNNFNLSLPPPRRQVPQLLSANPPIGPIQGHDHVNPHNGARSTPQPQHNLHVNRVENNFRRGAQGQLQRYYLSSSGSSHHNPQPHPNLHRPSMTSLPSVINVSTHQVFAPPYHQTLGDIRAPLQGHINFQGGNMLGHISHQAIMYHPLSQQVGPSAFGSSHGTQEMNHTIGASTSRNQNYQNEFVIPTLQPRVNREIILPQESSTIDMRRRLLTEIQYLLNQPMDRSTPMLEEMMLTDYSSLMLLEHGTTFQGQLNPPHPGLSVETIMGHIRRENFMSSVGTENPDDEEKCVICLEVYEDGDEIGKLDSCVHKFHVQCIKQWLMQRNVCPICKRIGLTINNAENEVGAVVNNENANP